MTAGSTNSSCPSVNETKFVTTVLGFPFSRFAKMPAKSDDLEWIWNPLQNP
jgi:hypothetical protein